MLKKMVGGAIVVEAVDPRWKNKMVSSFAPAATIAFPLLRKGIDSFKLQITVLHLTITLLVFIMFFTFLIQV